MDVIDFSLYLRSSANSRPAPHFSRVLLTDPESAESIDISNTPYGRYTLEVASQMKSDGISLRDITGDFINDDDNISPWTSMTIIDDVIIVSCPPGTPTGEDNEYFF